MSQRLAHPLALIAAVLALVAAGCGGDDDGGDDTQPAQTTQTQEQPATTGTEPDRTDSAPPADAKDPEGAFLAFQSALADGDADAVCGSLAPSAIKQVEEASIGGTCEKWVAELSGVYDPGTEAKLRKTKVDDVEESGGRATVKYTSPILNIPLETELEKSGDGWRITKLSEGV